MRFSEAELDKAFSVFLRKPSIGQIVGGAEFSG